MEAIAADAPKSVATYKRRSAPPFWRPDTHQIDVSKGRMIGYTPANELIQAAKSLGNQVGMTMVVLGVIERDSHNGASRHLGNYTACRQMISKGALGYHDMQGSLRYHSHRAGYAQKKDRKQSFQSDRPE